MGRPFKGEGSVAEALKIVKEAKSVEQLRQAQAVVLPLCYGLNLEQTAAVIGVSLSWASRLRNAFLAGHRVGGESEPARGGRHRENFTRAQEAELLKPFFDQAAKGGILVVSQIKPALEKALGRPMALSSAYNVLHRNGWRKLAPDKRHPQSDPTAQEAWKRTPRHPWRTPERFRSRNPDPSDVSGRSALRAHQRCASCLGAPTHSTVVPGHAHPPIHLRLRGRRCGYGRA